MTVITSPANAMIVMAGIRQTLAEIADLDQIHDLRDRAEAICHYVKTAALGLEVQNQAAEVKLCCERRLGQILSELPLQGGDRKSKDRDDRVTLGDLGISGSQSARWQREGSVPEEDFVRYVQQANEDGRELTSKGLLSLARCHADAAIPANDDKDPFVRLTNGLKNLARQQKRFGCIYADPPWPCGGKSEIARLPKRLFALPVKRVAASQAHLHLRVPPESLAFGLAVLRAWGFRYKTMAVRRRPARDYGGYWRQTHEVLLLGVRGRLLFRDSNLSSWLDGRDDSATVVHALIARASPPPFLDLFGTAVGTGWLSAGL